MPVFLLLPDRGPNSHGRVFDRQHGAMIFALRVAEPDLMRATGLRFSHHFGNGRSAILRQTVDAATHEESRPELFGQAVEFIDVAFPITDMHTALRCPVNSVDRRKLSS